MLDYIPNILKKFQFLSITVTRFFQSELLTSRHVTFNLIYLATRNRIPVGTSVPIIGEYGFEDVVNSIIKINCRTVGNWYVKALLLQTRVPLRTQHRGPIVDCSH